MAKILILIFLATIDCYSCKKVVVELHSIENNINTLAGNDYSTYSSIGNLEVKIGQAVELQVCNKNKFKVLMCGYENDPYFDDENCFSEFIYYDSLKPGLYHYEHSLKVFENAGRYKNEFSILTFKYKIYVYD